MKVAIVGPSAKPTPLFVYDEKWQFWGINAAYRNIRPPRSWSMMFNLHRFEHLKRDCPEYLWWDGVWSALNPKVPMVTVDAWPGRLLANPVIFPRKKLAAQPRADYHASSFDWLVAYAIHLKATHIAVHGVGFALDSNREEPISARACLEYWLGYAEGRGIKTIVARDCDIFYQYHLVRSRTVYGYDDVVMVEKRK